MGRRQRDVLDLGDSLTEFTAHGCSLRAAGSPGSNSRQANRPWYMATPFRPGSRPTTLRDLRNTR
jgi:hypothetical protein